MAIHLRAARLLGPSASEDPTQEILIPGLRAPKACVAFYSRAIADDTPRPDSQWGLGWCDAVSARAIAQRDEDGVLVADGARASGRHLVIVPGAFNDNIVGVCDFDSFISTGSSQGIRVNWADPHQVYVTYVLLGGDIETKVGHFFSSATVGGVVPVNFGMDIDAMLLIRGRSFTVPEGITPSNEQSIGFVARGPGDTVLGGMHALYQEDAQAFETVWTGSVSEQYKGRRVHGNLVESEPPGPGFVELNEAIEVDWISGGFQATTRVQANSQAYAYLAIRSLGSERWWAGRKPSRTTAGVQNVTEPGWKAEGTLTLATGMTSAMDTGTDASKGSRWGMGVGTAAGEEFSASSISAARVTVSDVENVMDQRMANLHAPDGSQAYKLEGFTPTANGWDQEYVGPNPGQAFHLFFLAVESPRITPPPIEVLADLPAPQLELRFHPPPIEVVVELPAPDLPIWIRPGPIEILVELGDPTVLGVGRILAQVLLQARLELRALALAALERLGSSPARLELDSQVRVRLEGLASRAARLERAALGRSALLRQVLLEIVAQLELAARSSARLEQLVAMDARLGRLARTMAALEQRALRPARTDRTISP